MAEAFEKVRGQFQELMDRMEKKQRTRLILASLFLLVSVTGLILYFTRTEYVVLYNNLEARQAGEVLTILESNNIKAKIGDTSGTILVSSDQEKQAQILVATEGLPTARFSYEDAISGNTFMMTSEERAQRFLVAQQNYLASTIELIPGIRKAVISLTIPETTGFLLSNEGKVAKAAVFLDIEPYRTLEQNSIDGIAVLVSNAVQGLSPENVTIHGSDGKVLNQSKGNGQMGALSDQMAMTQTVKNNLEQSINDFLSAVYGYGNVVVMANVKLDFDSQVTEILEFSPPIEGETEGIVRSMEQLQQNVVNGGTGGVPGTDANTDAAQYVQADENLSRYEEASSVINYEINELRQQIVKAQGQVQDITIAVYINSSAVNNGSLTDEELQQLRNVIGAAAGLDTRIVQVAVQAFNNSLQEQLAGAIGGGAPQGGLSAIPLWAYGILGALLLGMIFFAVSRSRRRNAQAAPAVQFEPAPEMEELDLELSGSQVKQQIEKLVNKKPEAVAQLLRNWLSEE